MASLKFVTSGVIALAGLGLGAAGCGNNTDGSQSGVAAGSAKGTSSLTTDTVTSAGQDSTAPLDPLQLSDEQRTQAQGIFGQLRTDVAALRSAAHADVRVVLTDVQQATLDLVLPPLAIPAGDSLPPVPSDGMGGPHGPHGFGSTDLGPGPLGSARASRGPGGLPPDAADALGLTEAQQASIDAIFSELHAAIQARHEEANSAFRAILTEEQIATLDEAPVLTEVRIAALDEAPMQTAVQIAALDAAPAGRPGAGMHGHGGPAGGRGPERPNPLQLTDEQQAQADAIFAQSRTDAEAAISAAREQVREVLTESQLSTLESAGDDASMSGPGQQHPNLPAGLTESLALTVEQATTIGGIADSLRTSLENLRAQTDTSYRAILSEEQLAQLGQFGVDRLFGFGSNIAP